MYSIKATNASYGKVGVKLTFSADSVTEANCDYVNIYIPHPTINGSYYRRRFSGSIGGSSILIPTTTFYVNFYSDGSVIQNGFKILPLELTTYNESDAYKDFNEVITITPSNPVTVTGINNTVESSHPYSNNFNLWWFWDTQLNTSDSSVTGEYYIYRDDVQDKALKLNSPKLDLQENAAGQLTFKMPSCNRGYNLIDRITTTFTVYRNDEEIWSGRIISIKEDFYKNKTITCEGTLAYLNDTTQPQELYSSISISTLLNKMLDVHNKKVSKEKRFTVANFNYDTTSQSTNSYDEVYTNYESTWNAISNKILGVSNGYFTLTKETNYTNPNVLRHRPYTSRDTCPQIIRFGKNLLDFTKDYDATQFCTVILPLGARLDDKYGISMSGIDGVSAYTTIESVNNGSMYYKNDAMVATYGWIEQVVHWDDEENPELLLKKAKEYLEDVQYDVMTLDVKAVDLSYLDVDYSQMKLSQRVRVISDPHNLDKYFPITKISIPLDNPANTTFTLGMEAVSTMSARNVKKTSQLINEIHDISTPKIGEALDDARSEASNLISNFTRGYITITQTNDGSNELYITKEKIPKNYNASNPTGNLNLDGYWRWNYNGLEFVNVKENKQRGWGADTVKLALDMTGSINADQICTGKLNANLIQAGILQNVDYGKGNGKDIFYLNLEQGVLRMNATSLTIGGSSVANNVYTNLSQSDFVKKITGKSNANDTTGGIYLDNGELYINASYIKAGTISANQIYGGTLSLGGSGNGRGIMHIYNSSNSTTPSIILDNSGLTAYSLNDTYFSNELFYLKYGIEEWSEVSTNKKGTSTSYTGVFRAFQFKGYKSGDIASIYLTAREQSTTDKYGNIKTTIKDPAMYINNNGELTMFAGDNISIYNNTLYEYSSNVKFYNGCSIDLEPHYKTGTSLSTLRNSARIKFSVSNDELGSSGGNKGLSSEIYIDGTGLHGVVNNGIYDSITYLGSDGNLYQADFEYGSLTKRSNKGESILNKGQYMTVVYTGSNGQHYAMEFDHGIMIRHYDA